MLTITIVLLLSVSMITNGLDDIVMMDDMYEDLPFEDIDGGVWKQGWDITYDDSQYASEPLNVHVVMHSHVDPGWIKTFDEYYDKQTKHILTETFNMVNENPRAKFIFAEMSYFHRWWIDLNQDTKDTVKRLLKEGRYEIVTGGWVMNDEANVHYTGAIMQLYEGHHFLLSELGIIPSHGWAIDPFGHSPTMAYILGLAGFEKIIINRVHYAIKKELATGKNLEFRWRQSWETEQSNSDIFTSMLPFFSYDMPHTCGPDPSVCSLFQFWKKTTSWRRKVEGVTKENIDRLSSLYVDQFKKKSQLYRVGNQVLILLGDDFKYDSRKFNEDMFSNHIQIHDYINTQKKFNTKIQFSTLGEYFDSIEKESKSLVGLSSPWESYFPVLTGDFFTYSDREQYYWSGYFTSRPYLKFKINELLSLIKSAEIVHTWYRTTLTLEERHTLDSINDNYYFNVLQDSRRALSLLQHHDGITGTAKAYVVENYGDVLLESFNQLENTMSKLLSLLSKTESLEGIKQFDQFKTLPIHKIITLGDGPVHLLSFNSLHIKKDEITYVMVDIPNVKVLDSFGEQIDFQISPTFDDNLKIIPSLYRVFFRIEVPALGYSTYTIDQISDTNVDKIAAVETNGKVKVDYVGQKMSPIKDDISIRNNRITVEFDKGFISTLTYDDSSTRIKEDFLRYTVSGGAYLFMPTEKAESIIPSKPSIRIVRGHLVQEVYTEISSIKGYRRVSLYNTIGYQATFVESKISFLLDESDTEIISRYSTNLKSEQVLYSDLNGLSFKRSVYRDDRPIPHNYYPISTQVFIEDNDKRFTVHVKQGHGCASLHSGEIEIMLDRRTKKDDGRGLYEAMMDNVRNHQYFRLTIEKTPATDNPNNVKFPTLSAHWISLAFNNNLNSFITISNADIKTATLIRNKDTLNRKDINIFGIKMRDPSVYPDQIVLQMSRLFYDTYHSKENKKFSTAVDNTFNFDYIKSIEEMSITLLHQKGLCNSHIIDIEPMEIKSFIISLDANPHNERPQVISEQKAPIEKHNQPEKTRIPSRFKPSPRPEYSDCTTNWTLISLVYLFSFVAILISLKTVKKRFFLCFLLIILSCSILQAILFFWC